MAPTQLKKLEKSSVKIEQKIAIQPLSPEFVYASKMYYKSKLLLDLLSKDYYLHITDDRWSEEFICCNRLNQQMENCFITHTCGSNEGSALIVKPYISFCTDKIVDGTAVEFARIYSDPFEFFIGDNDPQMGVDIPRVSWEEKLEHAKINNEINCRVAKYFLMQYDIAIKNQKECTDKTKLKYMEAQLIKFDIDKLKKRYKI